LQHAGFEVVDAHAGVPRGPDLGGLAPGTVGRHVDRLDPGAGGERLPEQGGSLDDECPLGGTRTPAPRQTP